MISEEEKEWETINVISQNSLLNNSGLTLVTVT
jgi:hypothetical protein